MVLGGKCRLARCQALWVSLGLVGLCMVSLAWQCQAGSRDLRGKAPARESRRESLPRLVLRAFEEVGARARQELVLGARDQAGRKQGSNFAAVQLALPLAPPIIKRDPARGGDEFDKNIVGLHVLGRGAGRCVVYGIGIAADSSFEEQMARQSCETHAFDCTVDPASPVVANKSFIFHPWCIGQEGAGFNSRNVYLRGQKAAEQALQFKKLSETMSLLGHTSIDVLKFDIEGFEWGLFESEILSLQNPPKQLSFELHTQGANDGAVPPHLVKGKGSVEVNKLFLSLHDAGYRVVSIEPNKADGKCSEFVLLHMDAS